MKKHIAVLAGDGIGPEITDGAIAVLNKVGEKFGHEFEFEHLLMGVCAIEETGEHCLSTPSTAASLPTAFCSARWAAPSATNASKSCPGTCVPRPAC